MMYLKTEKTKIMAAFFCFCIALVAFRMLVTQTLVYGFLLWNLMLSLVPLFISSWLEAKKACLPNKLLAPAFTGWLLFLPNAPYLLTDLLHFATLRTVMPPWFDLLLLVSFSLSGMLFGLSSISQMQTVLERRFGSRIRLWFVPACAFLCGFGMYLGRFERYNSWDMLSEPVALLQHSAGLLTQLKTIGFSLGYGILLWLVHRFFQFSERREK